MEGLKSVVSKNAENIRVWATNVAICGLGGSIAGLIYVLNVLESSNAPVSTDLNDLVGTNSTLYHAQRVAQDAQQAIQHEIAYVILGISVMVAAGSILQYFVCTGFSYLLDIAVDRTDEEIAEN
ncbi:MAG TPA: hypothetical protein VK914_11525 [bacterium]|jgi:hypothetical protein|nr:hypothetical protein [bacterium]